MGVPRLMPAGPDLAAKRSDCTAFHKRAPGTASRAFDEVVLAWCLTSMLASSTSGGCRSICCRSGKRCLLLHRKTRRLLRKGQPSPNMHECLRIAGAELEFFCKRLPVNWRSTDNCRLPDCGMDNTERLRKTLAVARWVPCLLLETALEAKAKQTSRSPDGPNFRPYASFRGNRTSCPSVLH